MLPLIGLLIILKKLTKYQAQLNKYNIDEETYILIYLLVYGWEAFPKEYSY
jgi:hypothetical protein